MSKSSLKFYNFKLLGFKDRKNVWTMSFISGESQGKSRSLRPKKPGRARELCQKKIGLKPWTGVTQFCRNHSGRILFSKSKLTNLKNSARFFQKSIYILKPHCLELFWYNPYSVKRRQRVPCMPSTRLSR